jgi:hypothetical protein
MRSDRIARIDDALSRGVVKLLLESSIVVTLLKDLILVGDKFKILREHHIPTNSTRKN